MKFLATALMAIPLTIGHLTAAAKEADPPAGPELIVDIDVNDEVYNRSQPLTENDIKTLVKQLNENGCRTLLVRCGFLGLLPYRTRLSYPIRFDAPHARANRTPFVGDLEQYIAQTTAWCNRYATVLRAFDPPTVFIREGHARGMKVLVWLDLFDDGYPGFRSKFLERASPLPVGRQGWQDLLQGSDRLLVERSEGISCCPGP